MHCSYGFTPVREPPIMSAVDLPAGFGEVELLLQGYPQTPAVDPDYGDGWAPLVLQNGQLHVGS
jgi:hypothetical protein